MRLDDLYDNYNYEKYIENKISYEDYEENSIHTVRCPNCNKKMNKYVDWEEYQGKKVPHEYWECPNGCESEDY